MKSAQANSGYTIVETLIFIVISGLIFISAFALFAGRQDQIRYQQGLRELDGQIQTMINDVANGYFPRQDNYECSHGFGDDTLTIGTGTSTQGKNQACVFAGKFISFPGGQDTIEITSIAARRPPLDTHLAIGDAALTPINNSTGISFNETNPIAWGLSIDLVDQNGASLSAFGALSSMGAESTSGGLASGARTVDLYTTTDPLPELGSGTPFLPTPATTDSVYLCIEDVSGSKKGVIIIGKDGRQLTTTIDQDAAGQYTDQCGSDF